jgi:hypothetical protein
MVGRTPAETIDEPDNHILGFLARLILDVGSMECFGAAPFMDANLRIRCELCSMIGSRQPAVFNQRFDLLLNFAVTALAIQKRRRQDGLLTGSVEQVLADIVAVMVDGLMADPEAPIDRARMILGRTNRRRPPYVIGLEGRNTSTEIYARGSRRSTPSQVPIYFHASGTPIQPTI